MAERLYSVEPQSLQNYRDASRTLGNLASAAFGIEFSEETIGNWESAFAFIKILDVAVDSGNEIVKGEAFQYFKEVFGAGSSPEINATTAYNPDLEAISHELRPKLNDRQAADFLRKGMQVFETVGDKEHNANSIKDYAKITRLLGQLTASLMTTVVSEQDKQHPSYGRYVRFFRRMSRAANTVDSVADFKRDYQEGTVQLQPTLANRARLLVSATPDFLTSFRRLGWNSFKLVGSTLATLGGHKARKQKNEPAVGFGLENLS